MLGLTSDRINIGIQYTGFDGTANDVSVATDFLDRFQKCKPSSEAPASYNPHMQPNRPGGGGQRERIPGDTVCYGEHPMLKQSWIDANVGNQGGSGLILGPPRRAKYKSCYMKKAFT